jgi:predicted dithiol-disulfide oxidoreductase (DUF899 family)
MTTGTREQWLKARLELLKAEKELTRRSECSSIADGFNGITSHLPVARSCPQRTQ